jgi:RNA polymerase sigma-70 factor (ECF subfamily)
VPDETTEVTGEHPDEAFVRRDLAQAALAAIGELSEVDRQTLLATFLDETPAATGATLRKRRERALTRLRNMFRSLYGLG